MTGFLFTTVVVIIVALIAFRVGPVVHRVLHRPEGARPDACSRCRTRPSPKSSGRWIGAFRADYVDSVNAGDVIVGREGNLVVATLSWQKMLHMIGNASILLEFEARSTRGVAHVSESARIAIEHAFTDPSLLRQALTHRSYGVPHNERLEFIGDAVLELRHRAVLYDGFLRLPEGELSRMRAHLVNKRHAGAASRGRLGLGACIRLGEGELEGGGARRVPRSSRTRWRRCSARFSSTPASMRARAVIDAATPTAARRESGDARQGPEDAAAGMAAGAAAAGARIHDRRRPPARRMRRVHRRMPHSRACRIVATRDGRQPPRRRAGRRDRCARPPLPQETRKHVADPDVRQSAAATSRSSVGRRWASRRCSTRWSGARSASRRKSRRRRAIESPASAPSPAPVHVRRHAGLPDPASHRGSTSG